MRKLASLFMATALALAMTACGDKDNTVTIAGGGDLVGTWASGCVAETDDSASAVLTFDKSSYSAVSNNFTTATGCNPSTTPDIGASEAGSFSAGAESSATLNGASVAVTQITLTPTSATWTVNRQTIVDLFNAAGFCGYTDWAAGVAKDILNTSCRTSSNNEIARIDTSVTPNVLYLADENVAFGADGWPSALDANAQFQRQ